MGEEKNFEKKSSKRLWIIIAAILILAAIAAGVFFFINSKKKPENIMKQVVQDVFDFTEKKEEEISSERVTVELTADIDSDNADIKTLNPIIKACKLKSTTEIDIAKKLFNENLIAYYDDDEIINADVLLQKEKLYLYLNDIYSKYIELLDINDVKELLEDEYGISFDMDTLSKYSEEMFDKKLLDDIEKIIIDKINSTEFEQEETKLNDQKVTKTKMKLTSEETTKLMIQILNKVNEYQKNDELADTIDELEEEMEYAEFDPSDYIEFTVYTQGAKNDIVKFTVNMISGEETIANIEYNEENDNKSSFIISAENTLMGCTFKEDGNKTTIDFVINPYETKLETAITVLTITITEENENEGLISISFDTENFAGLIDEEINFAATLNIKYKIEPNVKITERDTSNNIKFDDMTDEDYEEILENLKENPILYSLIQSVL